MFESGTLIANRQPVLAKSILGAVGNTTTINVNDVTICITALNITPEQADILLSYNTKNRQMSNPIIERMKSEIINGNWDFNGDTIRLARDEHGTPVLVDGQHRLAAISAAGQSVPIILVENLDYSVTDTIDQGRPRSVTDILRMAYQVSDLTYSNPIAAAARILILGSRGSAAAGSRRVVADFAYQNLETLRFTAALAQSFTDRCENVFIDSRRTSKSMAAGPLAALCFHMLSEGANQDLMTDFFERIAEGTISESDKTNVIPAIRRRQRNGTPLAAHGIGNQGAAYIFTEYGIYITAFNKWVSDQYVSKFVSPREPNRSLKDLPKVSTVSTRTTLA